MNVLDKVSARTSPEMNQPKSRVVSRDGSGSAEAEGAGGSAERAGGSAEGAGEAEGAGD